jgi:prepilin-type N-terminal cleavage/methylation domain-containing protein
MKKERINHQDANMTQAPAIRARSTSSFVLPPSSFPTAFTLIELMISLAIMVMLMLGVNMIFSSVGRATGAANASSKIVRDAQAAQTIMNGDMQGIVVTESQLPFLIIQNETIQAFRSRQEELGAPDPTNPMVDNADQGTGTITYSNTTYNNRNHRSDRLKFFTRGLFPRQTGNDGVFVADQTGTEAQITYAHLKLYSGSGTLTAAGSFPSPGTGTFSSNSSNYYASQWIFGRSVMLLVPPDATGLIRDNAKTPQNYYDYNGGTLGGGTFSPLRVGVQSHDPGTKWLVQSSRLDLAGTSIQDELTNIKRWYDTPINSTGKNPPAWWDDHTYRFWGNPFFLRPLNSTSASQTTPLFLSNCTQFMVEYAGDYLNQDQNGLITDACGYVTGSYDGQKNLTQVTAEYKGTTDGETDFIVLPNGQRTIRWYGLPRDLDGDGKIPTGLPDTNKMVDVLPLRDLIQNRFPSATAAAMERKLLGKPADYAVLNTGLQAGEVYAAIWGPSGSYGYLPSTDPANPAPVPIKGPPLPRLIRIIITLDDPNGRLNEGQTFEYVFRLQ